jgi:hypothetical protein
MPWSYGCNDHISLRSIDEEAKYVNFKSTGSPVADYTSLCISLSITSHPAIRRVLENYKLTVSTIHLDQPNVKLLMYIISLFPVFSELKLSNVDLDTGMMREISLKLPSHLKALTIETVPQFESPLDPELPLDEAENKRKVRDGNCAVGTFFTDFVSETSPLEALTLRQCLLRPEVLPLTFQAPQLKHLNLYDNPLGDHGAELLASALAGAPSLASLCVAKCDISHRGLAALLNIFSGKVASAEEASDFDKRLKEAEAKAKKAKQPVMIKEELQTVGNQKLLFKFLNFKFLHVGFNPIMSVDTELISRGYKNPVLSLVGCPVAETLAASTDTQSGWLLKLK